ncbi:MAG: hypothetical protein ACXQTR_02540 [Candidatus Methanospirareceae archaeon]
MSLKLPKTCSMGGSQTGLVNTIGITLLNPDGTVHTARTTTGIYEIGGGCYGKEITFDDNWSGIIIWDTGGANPVYAIEEYNIEGMVDQLDASLNTVIAKTSNLPSGIPKNVALPNFAFLMTDASDNAPKEGLTVTVQLSKDGGAFENSTNSVTELENGLYKIDLTQEEMNADIIIFKATATGANQTTLVLVPST